ncbi:TolC family protein [Hymenobacter caeli]|uniref:NodT family efflux transporter outer membrane factor (OMF) lipoprotein n=1 Tax=Hymenobacter caeli TaxID=2735894 RepID=A0ABX2FRK2_9BACT|nr:TolC family protein [Hymenobacter caeli]NRT19458.1 NodT family efflux transporter outer membrane factor (OMF) lipoprotein [Hymenobacter caeli]
MLRRRLYESLGAAALALAIAGCKVPQLVQRDASRRVPAAYATSPPDTASTARVRWKAFFTDPNLAALIDTALQHNQELNVTLQEIQIARNEVQARTGEYLPTVSLGARTELEKPGRYTLQGATEEAVNIQPDRPTPTPLANYQLGAFASWEVDVWHKLRNARKAAAVRYLASVEGKNFMVTNLIAEIANSYYELLALDNQLLILKQNIEIQDNALRIVKQEKEAARVTELAVKRFEAQVQNTTSLQYKTQQRITETENKLNLLLGRYPQPIVRDDQAFGALVPPTIRVGVPAQLLGNRPDIRRAEQNLVAAKLDVQVARANFYPSLGISAGAGFEAFKPRLLFNSPESMLYNLAGDLSAPLINRNGIKALYASANALQLQAVYNYERTVLNAYIEVSNQVSNISNLQSSYDAKLKEVQALNQSIRISNSLFKAVRADYTEVLLTQRDALESKFDLTETRMQQLNATVNVYRALGGGWQ